MRFNVLFINFVTTPLTQLKARSIKTLSRTRIVRTHDHFVYHELLQRLQQEFKHYRSSTLSDSGLNTKLLDQKDVFNSPPLTIHHKIDYLVILKN